MFCTSERVPTFGGWGRRPCPHQVRPKIAAVMAATTMRPTVYHGDRLHTERKTVRQLQKVDQVRPRHTWVGCGHNPLGLYERVITLLDHPSYRNYLESNIDLHRETSDKASSTGTRTGKPNQRARSQHEGNNTNNTNNTKKERGHTQHTKRHRHHTAPAGTTESRAHAQPTTTHNNTQSGANSDKH
jgi:hypothetical protein